ncbi:DUF5326 family protein [Streptomyces sp. NPDC057638]|uniref:DUF5326 family protein n=1 Tax=Streptomyces sp. NPDC057638 TaxID=3346190 RepID=UPI00367DE054
MAVRKIITRMPWWVMWVVVPLLVLAVFGGLIAHVIGLVVGLLFKALILVALIAGLVFVVRKFSSSSRSRGDW